jgi:hypothetical protein
LKTLLIFEKGFFMGKNFEKTQKALTFDAKYSEFYGTKTT